MGALLIAGTDTEVGKTFLTVSLANYWQKYRLKQYTSNNSNTSLGILKLIQTGVGDKEVYNRLFNERSSVKVVVPTCLATPIAPPIAAAREGKTINLGKIWQALVLLEQQQSFVLVESLGGLGSPITDELTVAHIAADWRLPTVLVVPVKLGAIANAVANVALARSLNVDLRGIVLNCYQPESMAKREDLTPVSLIQSLTGIPIIGTLPYIEDITDSQKLAQIVSNWDLELILPLKLA